MKLVNPGHAQRWVLQTKTTETSVDSDSSTSKTNESSEDQDDPLKKLTNFSRSVLNGALKWLRDNLNCGKDVYACELRSLKLKFLDVISPPVFTGTRIEGEESSLKVALVDAHTGQVVSSGPESCAKVEIVVLEGDFDGDDGDNWTAEEFKITLLGARLADSFEGISVQEAKTESFIVRDHRGELYKKHHPPSLSDEVWRLEKIGKEGAFHRRLSKERVNTVKDFLTLLYLDPTRLRNVLGTGMSTKMWEVTVEHAQTCLLDKKVYLYYSSGSVQKTGVVFNIVGQVMGLLPECQFVSADKLSETQKDDARNLVICAFRHWEEVVSFEDESSLMDWVMQISAVQISSNSSMMGSSDANDNVLTSQKISRTDYQHLSASTPDIMPSFCSIAGFSSLDDYVLHGIDNMDVRFDQPLNFPGQDADSLMADTDSITPPFCEGDHLPFFDTDYSLPSPNFAPSPDLQCAVNSFLARSSILPPDKAQRRWKMLFSVLRWFSVRRIVNRRTIIS
ncbi:calmodulin-binding protein 60 a [Nicotiana attenuata]|uniref:Calmodulin-binding protein 60 a n=1 Tax=Nicotiana attenuata TaxID=49451 RepID=A0A314KGR5_NICAT|nr:calmodulin-binding protein 60 a [Nicotiana attenuata]